MYLLEFNLVLFVNIILFDTFVNFLYVSILRSLMKKIIMLLFDIFVTLQESISFNLRI